LKKSVRAKNLERSSSFIDLKFLEKDMAKESLRGVLISSLVIYVLARSKEPIAVVLGDLLKIEIEAGQILEQILKHRRASIELKGYLAGVTSFTGSPPKMNSRVM
jgi:hypothetical protein